MTLLRIRVCPWGAVVLPPGPAHPSPLQCAGSGAWCGPRRTPAVSVIWSSFVLWDGERSHVLICFFTLLPRPLPSDHPAVISVDIPRSELCGANSGSSSKNL